MKVINKSKLPPGPKPIIPFGLLFSFRKDSIGFLRKIAKEYGDIVHFKIGPIRLVLLNHPVFIKEVLSTQHSNFIKGRPLKMTKELLGEGLLTSEGEFHKRQSQIIQPVFHRKMLESYAIEMTNCISELMNGWENGMKVDIRDEMAKMSMAIAGKTLFSIDLESEAPEIIHALNSASSLFGRVTVPFSEWLIKLPLPSTFRFYKAKARLDDTIYRMIDKRRQTKVDNGDLLSLLLSAQNNDVHGKGMSDKQVRDEALTLFLTAFDTTSNALNWTWYLLSQNPDAEKELHVELEHILQGRIPTVEDIPQLKYTRMVFGEAMRIFPPSWVLARQAINDFQIDRYTIPGGTLILMSPYLIHHDSRFHADPDKFNPYAWDEHSRNQSSKYEYFPFGGGPRACIGQSFAWMEGVLTLATIAQFWQIKLVPEHPVELLQGINLRPKHGMMMTLHQRKQ